MAGMTTSGGKTVEGIIKIMKRLSLSLFMALFLFSNLCYAAKWDTVPLNEKYYKNELKKPYWHMGVNLLYGGAYYLNIEEHNTYPKYIAAIRFILEKKYYALTPIMKLSSLIEYKEFTDGETYYASRFKASGVGMAGVSMKFPSPIPFIGCLIHYILIGGGYTFDLDYRHIFMDENRTVYVNRVQGDGPILGFSLGSEMELIKNLLYLDAGINYLYNYNIEARLNYEYELEEEFEEIELDFYIGFTYNLF